jgi:hypothetical protein
MKNLLLLLLFIYSAATAQTTPMHAGIARPPARIVKSMHATSFMDDKAALKVMKNTSGKYVDINKVNLINKTTLGIFTSSNPSVSMAAVNIEYLDETSMVVPYNAGITFSLKNMPKGIYSFEINVDMYDPYPTVSLIINENFSAMQTLTAPNGKLLFMADIEDNNSTVSINGNFNTKSGGFVYYNAQISKVN